MKQYKKTYNFSSKNMINETIQTRKIIVLLRGMTEVGRILKKNMINEAIQTRKKNSFASRND